MCRILALAASLTLLSACGAQLPSPLNSEAPAPLRVDLAALDVCRGLLKTVALADAKPGDDADTAFAKADAAAMTANDRIVAGRNCVADVQKRYAGKKGT